MKLIVKRVPDQSDSFRVWHDLMPGDTDTGEPIDAVGLIERVSDTVCEISMTKGKLTPSVMVEIGKRARALGYETLTFHRTTGARVSRLARFVKSEGGFDYYTVDLVEALGDV